MSRLCGPKYYYHSNRSPNSALSRRCSRLWIVPSLVALLAGCGASNSYVAEHARRVPVAHISELPEAERSKAFESLPIVFEVRKGDHFPLEVVIDSPFLKLNTDGPWSLVALDNFFVLLREDGGAVISEDGVDFDTKAQNSFNFGVVATKGQPAKVRLALALRSKSKAAE